MTMDLLEQYPQLAALLPKDFSMEKFEAVFGKQTRENTLVMVGLATILFYAAERNRNVKVEDIWDALEYCTSSLSVGYTDVYPQTPIGKIVGSALMTFGPSLVTRLTRAPEAPQPDPVQDEILATLRQIRDHLQRLEEKKEIAVKR
jgi:hypothetical protein